MYGAKASAPNKTLKKIWTRRRIGEFFRHIGDKKSEFWWEKYSIHKISHFNLMMNYSSNKNNNYDFQSAIWISWWLIIIYGQSWWFSWFIVVENGHNFLLKLPFYWGSHGDLGIQTLLSFSQPQLQGFSQLASSCRPNNCMGALNCIKLIGSNNLETSFETDFLNHCWPFIPILPFASSQHISTAQ